MPNAEEAKTAEVAAYCWKALGQSGFTRTDVIVGVGGGATTDLAGFVAATWLRGVRWIAVPTTVLGMVDAAVGGKTGINTAEGKNLVGAFHPPAGVLCDLAALDSLPVNDYVSGLAEIIKAGFIADPAILELIESDPRGRPHPGGPAHRRAHRALHPGQGRGRLRATSRSRACARSSTTATPSATPSRRTSATSGGTARPSPSACTSPPNSAVSRAGWTTPPPTGTARSWSPSACRCTYRYDQWPKLLETMKVDKKSRGDLLRFIVLDGLAKPTVLEGPDPAVLLAAYGEVRPSKSRGRRASVRFASWRRALRTAPGRSPNGGRGRYRSVGAGPTPRQRSRRSSSCCQRQWPGTRRSGTGCSTQWVLRCRRPTSRGTDRPPAGRRPRTTRAPHHPGHAPEAPPRSPPLPPQPRAPAARPAPGRSARPAGPARAPSTAAASRRRPEHHGPCPAAARRPRRACRAPRPPRRHADPTATHASPSCSSARRAPARRASPTTGRTTAGSPRRTSASTTYANGSARASPTPSPGWNDHSEAQYRLARRTCGFAARNFLANGISCILDDAVFPDRPVVGLGGWKRHVGPGLLPGRPAARAWRSSWSATPNARGNRRLTDEEVARIHGRMAGWYGSGLPIIDNSQLDVATTARVLDDVLARSIASPPSW